MSFNGKKQAAFTLVETLVALFIIVAALVGAATTARSLISSLVTLENQGEVFDLRNFVRNRISCDMASTCSYTDRPVKFTGCRKLSDITTKFDLKASCQVNAGERIVTVEYLRLNKADPSTPAIDIMTGKPFKWRRLFAEPITCNDTLNLVPNSARILVKHVRGVNLPYHSAWSGTSNHSGGGAAAFVFEDQTLNQVCKALNFPNKISASSPANWSSCSDNQGIKWDGTKFALQPGCQTSRYLLRNSTLVCAREEQGACE